MAQPPQFADKAKALIQARSDLQLSQRGLGDLIGVTQGTVARWENGDRAPSDRMLFLVYELLKEKRHACPMCGHDPAAARRNSEW